jgi:hypothetical protein
MPHRQNLETQRGKSDLITETCELALFRAQHEALLIVLGRKAGARFLRAMVEILSTPEKPGNVLHMTGGASPSTNAAAVAWYRDAMPGFLAKLLVA